VALFTRRSSPGSSRGLGWDAKSTLGSTAGSLFSGTSFGHTGFTGTSIWADPERNLFVVFLTNRVYPTRANTRISRVRPALHDAVIQALVPGAGMKNGRLLQRNGWRH
jgi:CubicO group peptidase (beta-lactamase class C family)